MMNYKECCDIDFENAMKQKNSDVKTISIEHLFILYTKFKADAAACFDAGTMYARGLGYTSENRANMYKEELRCRGIDV